MSVAVLCQRFLWFARLLRAIACAVFAKRPNSLGVPSFPGMTMARRNAIPKYLICDKDSVFEAELSVFDDRLAD